MSQYKHLSWLLAQNPTIISILNNEYATNRSYFRYLDDLAATLMAYNVARLREKMADPRTLSKFQSSVSELEIGKALSVNGKRVEMVPDNAWPWSGKRPDMIARDTMGEVYVEVKRIKEGPAASIIMDELARFLLGKPYRISATISDFLFRTTFEREERQAQEDVARSSVAMFVSNFQHGALFHFQTGNVTYDATRISGASGFPLIKTDVVAIPDEVFIEKLREDSKDKAGNRSSWIVHEPDVPYLVAFDSDDIMLDADMLDMAFLGVSITDPLTQRPDVSSYLKVQAAVRSGWRPYLEQKGIIRNSVNTSYVPIGQEGAFVKESILDNVSGLVLRNGRVHNFRPNPFVRHESTTHHSATICHRNS